MRIAVFCEGATWGEVDEFAINRGLGGRETALVQLAMNWAEQGHEVYAFVPRSNTRAHVSDPGSVTWIPCDQAVEITMVVQPDVFISWENVAVLAALTDMGYSGMRGIEMQVAHLESPIAVSEVCDRAYVLSRWAERFFLKQHPDMAGMTAVLPNGVDMARFDGLENTVEGAHAHFIYSSSPDRGLHHLLRAWPLIVNRVNDEYGYECTLHVCYGIENFIVGSKWGAREDAIRAVEIERLIGQPGVQYHGKIGQDELARLMVDCDLMLYPCDTMSPTETGCISIVEALAAGTPVVTTDCDCIGEDFGAVTHQVRLPWTEGAEDEYADLVVEALNPEDYDARASVGREFAQQRDWSKIAADWIDDFKSMTRRKEAA